MCRICRIASMFIVICLSPLLAADWRQFRGPGGQGVSNEKGLPTEWSAEKNIVWKAILPARGRPAP